MRAEEQRRLEEEAAAAAEAERKKREEEEKVLALRKEREADRAAALEKARLQQQREEEAETRRQARREAEKAAAASTRKPLVAPSAVRANGGESGWRRDTPANSTPPTPTRASNAVESAQRPESPSPAAAVPRYRPGAATGGGWRAREEAKAKEMATAVPPRVAAASPRPASPAHSAKEEPKTDDDGFQTVDKRGSVWRARRGRA